MTEPRSTDPKWLSVVNSVLTDYALDLAMDDQNYLTIIGATSAAVNPSVRLIASERPVSDIRLEQLIANAELAGDFGESPDLAMELRQATLLTSSEDEIRDHSHFYYIKVPIGVGELHYIT